MVADDTTSLETELARFADSAATEERRQQLMAFRFYLHRVIDHTVNDWLDYTEGFTHHLTLLDYLLDWQQSTGTPVRLATFNYDVLLERAAESVITGWSFGGGFNDYTSRADWQLFKLHGSTSWSRVTDFHGQNGMPMIDAAMRLAAAGALPEADIEPQPPRAIVGADARVSFPAIAIPLENKTDFECPGLHLEPLRRALPEIKHVLIIGWRAAERHAVEFLTGSEPREGLFPGYSLGIVDHGDAGIETVRENLGLVGQKGRFLLSESQGFSGFIRNLDARLAPFLASGY